MDLTPSEIELWPAALLHQWWEEGTWALEDNDDAAWADDRQRSFLLRPRPTRDPQDFWWFRKGTIVAEVALSLRICLPSCRAVDDATVAGCISVWHTQWGNFPAIA